MGFKCGIVGLPNVGKSTLFNALTASKNAEAANFPFCTIDPNIGIVDVFDNRLDQGTIEKFCDFIKMDIQEFWHIMDKWYNKELFEQDIDGLWHPKFKVGTGIIK